MNEKDIPYKGAMAHTYFTATTRKLGYADQLYHSTV